MDNSIPDNDPLVALKDGLQSIDQQRGPLDWGTFTVGALSEVEVFLFSARGQDGKEISGLAFRPLVSPDRMFAVTSMAPIGREIVMRMNNRLPPPRAPQKAPPKRADRPFVPQAILPPTPGQANAPAELIEQGLALTAEANQRRAAMMPVNAPGSTQIAAPVAMPVVLPRNTKPARASRAAVPDLPPDLDEGGIEQG